jgi:hypothetical protein
MPGEGIARSADEKAVIRQAKLKVAADRRAKARKRVVAAESEKTLKNAKKATLEGILQAQSEEDKVATENEISQINQAILGVDSEMKDAEDDLALAEKEGKDVEMEVLESTEPPGGEDEEDEEDEEEEDEDYHDLINYEEMKEGLGLTGGKCKGWTRVGREGMKPVVQFGPNNSACFRTLKQSKFDGIIDPDKKYNLVKQRRYEVKDDKDVRIFKLSDISSGQGVSYRVPDDYVGNPAEILKPLPPRLTIKEKDDLRKRGLPVPSDPPRPQPVQVFLKWNRKHKGELRSFETRSGIRGFYGNNAKGDAFIYEIALEQEARYQKYILGERVGSDGSPTPHPPHRRSRTQWTPAPPPPEEKGSPPPPGEKGSPPPPEEKGSPPPPEEKEVPPGPQASPNIATKKAFMAEFLENYFLAAGVDKFLDLSGEQRSDAINIFKENWAKHLGKQGT